MHEGSENTKEKRNRLYEGRVLRSCVGGIKRRRGNPDVAHGSPGGSEDGEEENKQGSI